MMLGTSALFDSQHDVVTTSREGMEPVEGPSQGSGCMEDPSQGSGRMLRLLILEQAKHSTDSRQWRKPDPPVVLEKDTPELTMVVA